MDTINIHQVISITVSDTETLTSGTKYRSIYITTEDGREAELAVFGADGVEELDIEL